MFDHKPEYNRIVEIRSTKYAAYTILPYAAATEIAKTINKNRSAEAKGTAPWTTKKVLEVLEARNAR